jgi:hypothetical protein
MLIRRLNKWVAVLILGLSTGMFFIGSGLGSAIDLNLRSVTISSAVPSAVTTHTFRFSLPTTNDVGSIVLEYCDNSPIIYVGCGPPAGLDASAATLSSQSGNVGFSIDAADSTASKIVLSRPAIPGTLVPNTYVFDNITNPSAPGETTYVRLSTYASSDGSGPFIDKGAVAFAVQSIFTVGTYVPPFVRLCVGITVAPDCSSFLGDRVDLGILSSAHANAGQSQFAIGTNDPNGYNVYALGTTMTSGNNVIAAAANPVPSFPGTPQFGINLRANLLPPVGQDPVGLGTGVPTTNYNIPNRFVFNDGDTISSSPLSSDYNRMTVSYLVNVPKSQTPGVYATTVTYLGTVQF